MLSFRQITPSSERDSRNEKHEYMLVWLSPYGGVRQWLFSHTDISEREDFKLEQIETLDSTRSVPVSENKEVDLITTSLNELDLDYVKSIMQSNQVFRFLKDGTSYGVSIDSASVKNNVKQKEYDFSVKIIFKEEVVLNV